MYLSVQCSYLIPLCFLSTLIIFNVEKDRSAVAIETDNVARIYKSINVFM